MSRAAEQAELWRESDPEGAELMDWLAGAPLALWIGDWDGAGVQQTVDRALDAAGDQVRSFVVYDIPERDCGNFSAGGAADAQAYRDFIADVAAGLDGRLAIVVLEPDALPLIHCLDEAELAERLTLMSEAVDTLTAAGAAVYLDAGDSDWIPAAEMAGRLEAAGVHRAAGFSLNVSHTEFTADEIGYAESLRAILGPDVHYVVDTSRSGLGPSEDHAWCNPLGRATGDWPTLQTGHPGLDALLWIKTPGGSDGNCNGGPDAGAWWPEYARELAANGAR